jgi:predicted nuclease of predicted toxin-antitoxin system
MRILLDENLPHRLRHNLPDHEVATAAWMGWAGIANGKLLDLAETNGFDVFITADQSVPFQQNVDRRNITIIVLVTRNNDAETFELLMRDVLASLDDVVPGTIVHIGEQV